MTPVQLINLALKMSGVLGVGQTASAEDTTDAFELMKMMLAQWQTDRFLVYRLAHVSVPCTGQQSYTVGPGGDFDIQRPTRISSAFARQQFGTPNPVDYTLAILNAREDYDKIIVKQQRSFPAAVFYDSDFPVGTLYPWSIPDNSYELHISVYTPLGTLATEYDEFDLPPEYQEAILFNLCGRLRLMYQLPNDEVLNALGRNSVATLRGANAQVPRMSIDQRLIRKGTYNPLSDTYN